MEDIIRISWDQYISKIIHDTRPEKIIVIGKGVAKILVSELRRTIIPFHVQSQPQGIRSKIGLRKSFEKYYEICNS